jgi:Ca-activated chloride channel family protein
MKGNKVRTILLAILIPPFLFASTAFADSAGSRNQAGNRLFEQGKYQDAEKAYLDAQVTMPGKPELSYNLGNSLIKQKKYDQALQSLRLALSRGDRNLQANSWYNAGNALYETGNFQDSAQAFIQSLRLNPSDRDAKHNLELALKKMQEQQQNSQGEGKPDSNPNQSEDRSKRGNQKAPSNPQNRKPSDPSEDQGRKQAEQQARSQQGISKERALQILDALKNQELADRRKAVARPVLPKGFVRDW